ncbi:MAG: hypothetical protein ACLGJB_02480 [Blastocatellia bacterium]
MPPGKEGKIELAVEHTDGYVGEIAKSAGVTTNDPAHASFNLMLRARFKMEPQPGSNASVVNAMGKKVGPLSVEPMDRWVTSVLTGSSTATTMYLVNNEANPIHVKKVEPGGTDFSARVQPIQEGKRFELFLSTNPDLKPGEYHQTLKILTDSAAMPELPIRLDVTVFPRVFASPTSIMMPTLSVTSDLASINWPMINVRKVQAGGLKIKSYSSTLPFIKLDLLTAKEGELYQIRITIDNGKVKPGEFKGMVHIETNDANVPVIDIPLKVAFN